MTPLPLLLIAFLTFPSFALAEGHGKHYCQTCPRDKQGEIKRSQAERKKFLKSQGLTHTPKGYVVDHIVPLYKGGEDKAENMQLITVEQDRLKDRP